MNLSAKPGLIYVLTHSSMREVFKVGVTAQKVEKRLAQHNSNYSQVVGQVVKETGIKWEIKEYHPVSDIYTAEAVFWAATGIADIPYRNGVELFPMDEKTLRIGIEAAKNSGVASRIKKKAKYDRDWMAGELEGSGISHVGQRFNHVQYTEFKCEHGHVFKAIPRILANNKWCPVCKGK
jgi:predicted GIY-YIG superfamily endonuclease